MIFLFGSFLIYCWSLTTVNGISTYYMDQLCGTTLHMENSFDRHSIRVLAEIPLNTPNCALKIKTSSQYQLMFFFKDMDLNMCSRNWLEIHDGGSSSDPIVTGLPSELCGNHAPTGSFHTSGNMMTLVYQYYSNFKMGGFDMVITRYHTGHCKSHEFSCSNGRCIDDDLTCNGYNPCGNDSDCPLPAAFIPLIAVGSLSIVVIVTCLICHAYKWRRRRRMGQLSTSNTTPSYGILDEGHNQPVFQQYPALASYPTGTQPPPSN